MPRSSIDERDYLKKFLERLCVLGLGAFPASKVCLVCVVQVFHKCRLNSSVGLVYSSE